MSGCATGILIDLCSPKEKILSSPQQNHHSSTNSNSSLATSDDCFSLNSHKILPITSIKNASPVCGLLIDISSREDSLASPFPQIHTSSLKPEENDNCDKKCSSFQISDCGHNLTGRNVCSSFSIISKNSSHLKSSDSSTTSGSKTSWSSSGIFAGAECLEDETFDFNISLSPSYRSGDDEVFHSRNELDSTFIMKGGLKVPLSSEQMEEIHREASILAQYLSQPQKIISSGGNSQKHNSLHTGVLASLTNNMSFIDIEKTSSVSHFYKGCLDGEAPLQDNITNDGNLNNMPTTISEKNLDADSKMQETSYSLQNNTVDQLSNKENLSPALKEISYSKKAKNAKHGTRTAESTGNWTTATKLVKSISTQNNSPSVRRDTFTVNSTSNFGKVVKQTQSVPKASVNLIKNNTPLKRPVSAGEMETSGTKLLPRPRLSTIGNASSTTTGQQKSSINANFAVPKPLFCSPKVTSAGLKTPGSAPHKKRYSSSSSFSSTSLNSSGKPKLNASVDLNTTSTNNIQSLRLSNKNSSTSSSTKSVEGIFKKVVVSKNINETSESAKFNTKRTGPLKATTPLSQMTKQENVNKTPRLLEKDKKQGLNTSLPILSKNPQSSTTNASTPIRKYANTSMTVPTYSSTPRSLPMKNPAHSTPHAQIKKNESRRLSSLPTPIRSSKK